MKTLSKTRGPVNYFADMTPAGLAIAADMAADDGADPYGQLRELAAALVAAGPVGEEACKEAARMTPGKLLRAMSGRSFRASRVMRGAVAVKAFTDGVMMWVGASRAELAAMARRQNLGDYGTGTADILSVVPKDRGVVATFGEVSVAGEGIRTVRVAGSSCGAVKGGMVDVARALCMAKRLPGARWFWNGHVLVAVGADGHFAGMLMPVVLW